MKYFPSGAIRSSDAESTRYDLISPIGLRRLAETYAYGARKYGDDNWLKGIPASDLFNHAVRHLYLWLAGDRSEDHLAHSVWNIMAIMHFEEMRPELIDIVYLRAAGTAQHGCPEEECPACVAPRYPEPPEDALSLE